MQNLSANIFDKQHIELHLTSLVTGSWKPTQLEQESLLDHLTQCVSCQIALRTYIAMMPCSEERTASFQTLATTIHNTCLQVSICAYVEVLRSQGKYEARKQFPLLSTHLEKCVECRSHVEEICMMLTQAEEAELQEELCVIIHE
jgi:hypothetical protein